MSSTIFVIRGAAAAALCALAINAFGQAAFPAKPIRLVVPFVPGGSTDLIARILAQKLEEPLGQQVVVENRAGAGGNIGVDYVAKSQPDGYTLIFGHIGTFGFGPSLYQKLPYDPVRDFAPVVLFASVPNMLVVHPSLPVKNVRELIALAKAHPGKINYGSSGNGSASHLATEYFKLLSKTELTPIPYKGTGPLVTDVIAGQISLTITGVPPLMPLVQSGRLRALGVGSVKRLAQLPEIPTIAEAGVPGYESSTWFGPLAPAKTPREVIVKLNSESMKILQRPDVRTRFTAEGVEALGSTPEEFGAYVKTEIDRWGRVIKAAGVAPQ